MSKKTILFILIITIICLNLFQCVSVAEDISDLQIEKNELQEQITESSEQIEDIQIELTENLEQINNLNQKISIYESEITSLEENLSSLEAEIEQVNLNLTLIEENYNAQREVLQNRLVALYEAGDVYYLDVLLNSTSFSDFISNYFLIGEIVKYDNDLLESIEEQKNEIEEIKENLTQTKDEIETVKDDKEKISISLENSIIIRNSYVEKLTQEEQETQAKLDEYQAELNSIDDQITAITTLNLDESYVGGEFIWPAPGYYTITSRYGWRYHPVLKVNNLHKGTDIAMTTGSTIVASNDGVVIKAMYTTGYGNMVMIDHGGGITTVYGHGSEIVVETGQIVTKGEEIMKAGSTGWSTGPHLHFEVRIDGTPIDSLEFLNNQSEYLGDYLNNEEDEDTQTDEGTNQEDGGEN